MIELKRGTYHFGLGLLGLLYDNLLSLNEDFFRTAESHGVKFIRCFVSRRDKAVKSEYDEEFWDRFNFVCRMAKKYGILMVFVPGYYRANKDWTTQDVDWLIDQIAPRANNLIGRGKWAFSLANEPSGVPAGIGVTQDGKYNPTPKNSRYDYIPFEGPWIDPARSGGNNHNTAVTSRLAAWFYSVSRRMEKQYGVPLNYQFGCIRYDPLHPAAGHLQTSDPIVSGLGGLWFGEDRKKEVSVEMHKAVLTTDLVENLACGHYFKRARELHGGIVSSDGTSEGSPTGRYLTVKGRKVFQEASREEFREFTKTLYKLATKGVRRSKFDIDEKPTVKQLLSGVIRYKYFILHEDLPRSYFVDTSAPNPDDWVLDLRATDWEKYRQGLPPEYWKQQGCTGLIYPLPEPEEPVEPDPEPEKPEPVKESPWRHLVPKWRWRKPFILINFKAFLKEATFWQCVLLWISVVFVIGIPVGILWLLLR